jgi:hypothetical protein
VLNDALTQIRLAYVQLTSAAPPGAAGEGPGEGS